MWVEHHPKGWSPRLNRKEKGGSQMSATAQFPGGWQWPGYSHYHDFPPLWMTFFWTVTRINLSSHGHSSTPITIIRLSGACITWPTGSACPTLSPTLSPGLPLDMTPLPGAVHLVQTQPCTSNSQTRLWHLLPNHLQWPLASAAALTSSLSKAALTLVWYQPVCLSLLLCVSLCLTLKTIMWPES